jgi:ribosomal-protein-alanine N-acetyltransferase
VSAVLKQPALQFRPMLESDIKAVHAVETAAYEFPWSRVIFQDCLRVGYCCWVMERDRVVAGYGVMAVAVGESHILNLCVHPVAQNLGLGRSLLDYLLDVARRHKADCAYLEVRPSNIPARRLYARAGFEEVGMRRNYYPARLGREDAIIMAKSLD